MPVINPHIQNTNAAGFRKLLSSTTGVSPWPSSYGSTWTSIFKPFTTNTTNSGVPHYQEPLFGLVPGRFVGASASGLNPFGYHTYNEGILSGSSNPTNIETSLNPNDVRTHGVKTPITYVGWGYDNFGYPAPNSASGWTTGGNHSPLIAPSSLFLAVSSGNEKLYADHGSKVFYSEYLAGPLDIRFDINRKVWSSPQSVYAAHIIKTYLNGAVYTTSNTPQFAEQVRYDVAMFDGVANPMVLSNVAPVSSRPAPSSFKILPLVSGNFCFIVHTSVTGIPGFGVFAVESPGSEECITSTGVSQNSQVSFNSLTVGTGVVQYDALLTTPLATKYGGLGFSTYNSRQMLAADGSGSLKKYTVQTGSGIEVVYSENSSSTGSITIRLSTGVMFTAAGINNTINELQGLTTPLTVGQGGTGSTTKNFIDLTTTQTASGIKQFSNQVRAGYYSTSGYLAGYAFATDTNAGLGYLVGTGLAIIATGQCMMLFTSGISIKKSTVINSYSGNEPPFVVRQHTINTTNDIQQWQNNSGTTIGKVTNSGYIYGQALEIATSGGNKTSFIKSTGTSTNTVLCPTGDGTLLLSNQIFGYTGNITIGTGIMVVENGIIKSFP